MISLDKINLSFGGFELFKEISFLINPKDRIGLIGKNGAGKTTLLKIVSGTEHPTSGSVGMPKDVSLGYLPQQMKLSDTRTLKEEAVLAFEELLNLEKRIARLNTEIAESEDYHSEEYLNKLDIVTELNERYQLLGGDNYEAELERTLIGLGFERTDFNRPTSDFSGGWRMRVELAKILLKKPDVFLLDEPTNHLDIESIQWLEDFLKDYKGAVVLVSHDKTFLNAVCNRTIEISLGKILDQKMNYSAFLDWKQEQKEITLAAYRNQQKMIDDTEKFIERFRYKASKAVQVQSRIKQLEKINRIEIEEEDNAALKLNFPPAPRSGKVVVEGKNISKSYGDLLVLKNVDLTIESGDKIAFVGRNGEGKTTLARIIMNELAHEGQMTLGHNVKVGYFAQNQAQLLNEELTVFETIDEIAVGDIRTKIRDILAAFLFRGEDIDKKVKVLSGGEKSRLAMIRLMLEPVNFLILDEPTNHLDIRSKEILKNALNNFTGTVLVVSHDRDFLDGLVNCVYEFRNKKAKQYLGGIFDFLYRKKMESLKELETQKGTAKSASASKEKPKQELSFEEQKEINRNISRLEKKVETTETQIAEIEDNIKNMDKLLASPESIEDQSVFDQYEQLKHKLEQVMYEWELLHEELEDWTSRKTW
ncbi:ABC-F family ATP-binding cassette domain-containing protein [Maribellus sediminis]|uniref:ABC-F family ATP-binding cassette domain-containing protein n=1 Tax=Maribellus sediminis TaxID=2696285 RepID=UPI001430D42F|nr:ATP-binding cassette domain-containing protein [Maribellus sediminis]